MHLVTYFELLPTAIFGGDALIREYAEETRSAPGIRGLILLREIARPNRFVMHETWQDIVSANDWGPARTALRENLASMLGSGFEARPYEDYSMTSSAGASAEQVYIVTHVDVFPPFLSQAIELVQVEVDAARRDAGNLQFDILQWIGIPNHFTFVSVWRDEAAAEASLLTSHTREFRAALAPIEGAPFDARLYRVWS